MRIYMLFLLIICNMTQVCSASSNTSVHPCQYNAVIRSLQHQIDLLQQIIFTTGQRTDEVLEANQSLVRVTLALGIQNQALREENAALANRLDAVITDHSRQVENIRDGHLSGYMDLMDLEEKNKNLTAILIIAVSCAAIYPACRLIDFIKKQWRQNAATSLQNKKINKERYAYLFNRIIS